MPSPLQNNDEKKTKCSIKRWSLSKWSAERSTAAMRAGGTGVREGLQKDLGLHHDQFSQ